MILGFGKSSGKSFVCYATAEMHRDIEAAEIDEMEESTGWLAVEITRRNESKYLCCKGSVLRWSSPKKETYSRVGRFTYFGDREGRLCDEQIQDGQPAEVAFDWFTDEPKIIEII